ncbi:hypothetical protein [Schleiferilactobacillus perolens]|nr:hypothetical protein [Schleiferilactobacillus perolens]
MAKLEEISAAKVKLGYPADTSRVVYAQTDDMVGRGFGIVVAALSNPMFYLSFEEDGLLMLECTPLYKLTGKHILIGKEQIKSLHFEKEKFHLFGMTNGHSPLANDALMVENNDGDVANIAVWKRLVGFSWVKQNHDNVVQLLNQGKIHYGA